MVDPATWRRLPGLATMAPAGRPRRHLRHLRACLAPGGRAVRAPVAAGAAEEEPLRLRPLADSLARPELSFGAEVSGFDLRQLADAGAGRQEVYDALVRHGGLIFRRQQLTEQQETALAMCFPHNASFRPPALEYLGNTDKHGNRLEEFVRGGRCVLRLVLQACIFIE